MHCKIVVFEGSEISISNFCAVLLVDLICFYVVVLCITHQRERERKRYTSERERREESVETVSIATSQERRNEREKTNLDWKKPAKQPKRNERDFREKNKSKEEETL